MDLESLAAAIDSRRKQGARTLNLLGGEPAVNLPDILTLLGSVDPDTQVVWNSNMYYGEPTIQLLEGVVDLYLADLKCGNRLCSAQILGAADYCEVAQVSIQAAARQCDTIVRHVLMPGHWDCCFVPVAEWVSQLAPPVRFSLRLNYVPPAQAKHTPLSYVTDREGRTALDLVKQLDLDLVT